MEKYGLILINFGSSIILARLLAPDEIGIFSIVIFFVSLAHTIRDLGVSSYIIQENNLTSNHIKSAQFLTIAMSWLMAGLLFLVSKPASEYYAEPQVEQIMLVLIINFIILPFGSITSALLRRNLEFGKLSKINITTCFIQAATGVTMAYCDYGAISLAWGGVAGTASSVLLLALHRKSDQPWAPGTKSLKSILDKGIKFSGASIFYDIGQGAPELISAKVLSFHETGLLSRGTGAVMLIHRFLIEATLPVLLSHFASILRTNPRQFKNDFLTASTNIATLAWPAFGYFSTICGDVILILYGAPWIDAAPIASILCLGFAFAGLSGLASSVIIGAGDAGLTLKIQGYVQTIKVALAFVGAKYDIIGVAIAITSADIIGSIASNTIVCKKHQIGIKPLLKSLKNPAILTAVIIIISIALKMSLANLSEPMRIITTTPVIIFTWVTILHLLKMPLLNTILETRYALFSKTKKIFKRDK